MRHDPSRDLADPAFLRRYARVVEEEAMRRDHQPGFQAYLLERSAAAFERSAELSDDFRTA